MCGLFIRTYHFHFFDSQHQCKIISVVRTCYNCPRIFLPPLLSSPPSPPPPPPLLHFLLPLPLPLPLSLLLLGPYLLVVTEKRKVGELNGHAVWEVKGCDVIPFTRTDIHLNEAQVRDWCWVFVAASVGLD